jgi:Fe-S-cluster containining protein
MVQTQIRREDLKPGEVLCAYCTGKCCRYFALPIETPTSWEDFDHIRWYMMHGDVSIFVEDETWYLMVHADCQHLLPDHRCGAYETRPQICRKYTTDDCEYDDDACYEKLFESPEQIWEYAAAVLPPRKRTRPERRKLPVVTA